jgi:hypothetical protein
MTDEATKERSVVEPSVPMPEPAVAVRVGTKRPYSTPQLKPLGRVADLTFGKAKTVSEGIGKKK